MKTAIAMWIILHTSAAVLIFSLARVIFEYARNGVPH